MKFYILLFILISTNVKASMDSFIELRKRQIMDLKDEHFDRVLLRGQYYRLHYLKTKSLAKKYFSPDLLTMEIIALERLCQINLSEQLFLEFKHIVKPFDNSDDLLKKIKEKMLLAREYNTLKPTKKIKFKTIPLDYLKWSIELEKIGNLTLDQIEGFLFELKNKCDT